MGVEQQQPISFVAVNPGIHSVWMVLTDIAREGRWGWNNNKEQPTYTNFASHSHDNSHNYENVQDCMQIYSSGLLDDLWCENIYSSHIPEKPSPVCELE